MLGAEEGRIGGSSMVIDLIYLVVVLIFFAVSAAYVRGCDKLGGDL